MKNIFLLFAILFVCLSYSQTKYEYYTNAFGIKNEGEEVKVFPGDIKITIDLKENLIHFDNGGENPITMSILGSKVIEEGQIFFKVSDIDVSAVYLIVRNKVTSLIVYPTFPKKMPTTYYNDLRLISKS